MSSGSYFLILKELDLILDSDTLNEYNTIIAERDCDLFSNNKSIELKISNLQKTQPIPNNELEYIEDQLNYYDIKSGKTYSKILSQNFLSDFICLKDYFNMNPYSSSGEIEIDIFNAYKMREALIYIKSSSLWDKKIEDFLLDKNEYLYVFDELSNLYLDRFNKFSDIIHERNYNIENLIDVLNNFISLHSKESVKLIYKTW